MHIGVISIDEIKSYPKQWVDTSLLRNDGKIEYREQKEFGNRHVVFENGAFYGNVHVDKYNATDIPFGTINHATNYVEEKTGIPKDVVTIVGAIAGTALGLYAGHKALKWINKNS